MNDKVHLVLTSVTNHSEHQILSAKHHLMTHTFIRAFSRYILKICQNGFLFHRSTACIIDFRYCILFCAHAKIS